MQHWLRATLLAFCAAIGIAVALALALATPPSGDEAANSPQLQPKLAARLTSAAEEKPLAENQPPSLPALIAPAVPVVAPYRDIVARQVGQLEESLQELEESSHRRERSMLRALAALQDRIDEVPRRLPVAEQQPAPEPPNLPPFADPPSSAVEPAAEQPPADSKFETRAEVRRAEGDDNLSINIQNTDIRAVLEMIARETGLNIIASRKVTGAVTANLNGVDLETALAAILKSTGFAAAREGNILYIGEPLDLQLMNQSQDRINTRIYRPNYIKASDLQTLFTPLISSEGKITVSAPAMIDIPADQNKTGGNAFAGLDTVIVRDYEMVLVQLDEIFAEVDTKPRQVAIEAMILSVRLNDTFKFGVNFSALRDQNNTRLVSGSPASGLGSISVADGGLHFGFLDATAGLFIDCLEKIGDTNVIASPRLTCLNKQRAEIQIGQELGYVSTTTQTETASTQSINFLSVGTLLRIRPYIGNDGLIRLEVHPELSTGTVEVEQGLSLPQKSVTQVTTNVLCPDGCTVVIGGLIREDLTNNVNQLPYLGNVPYLGWLFRQKNQGVDRNEIIVLITPRIVSEPFMCKEGIKYGNDFTQRQSVYFDKMSPLGKRNLALHHLRLARAAYNAGDPDVAMKQVNLAIHYDPLNRESITFRNEIVAAGGFEDESIHEYLHRGLLPGSGRHHDYSKRGYPWKDFEGFGPSDVSSVDDPGITGHVRTVVKPAPVPSNVFEPRTRPQTRTLPAPEALPPPQLGSQPTPER
jgi:type IV pilus assembly protein PilQ